MGDRETADRLRATGERIDVLLDAASSGGAVARERAEELVRLVSDLYAAGLERVLDILYDAGGLDDQVLAEFAADDLVASLLLVHGLHPYDMTTRVEAALESVRPYLGTHGGDVELVEVTDSGAVRLRLLGSCDGCPSSSVTLKLAVEGAIEAAAPETTSIEVETPVSDGSTATAGLIPVTALRSRLDEPTLDATWEQVSEAAGVPDGAVARFLVKDVAVMVARIGPDLFAYLDRCARCEQSLEGAVLSRRLGAAVGDAVLRCPSCRAHFDVRRAGACLDDDGLHLDPLPLLRDGPVTSVAVVAPVSA